MRRSQLMTATLTYFLPQSLVGVDPVDVSREITAYKGGIVLSLLGVLASDQVMPVAASALFH